MVEHVEIWRRSGARMEIVAATIVELECCLLCASLRIYGDLNYSVSIVDMEIKLKYTRSGRGTCMAIIGISRRGNGLRLLVIYIML